MLDRRKFLKTATCSFASLSLLGCGDPEHELAQKPKRPNMIFLLADDLGYTDLSCAGSDLYQTPNIDRLASQGMWFKNAYSSAPTCAPSRAAIMTGKYPARLGIVSHGDIGTVTGEGVELPLNEYTIAEALRDSGYTTCHIGKWHIGKGENSPANQGFDYDWLSNEFCQPGGFIYPYEDSYGLPPEKAQQAKVPDVDESMSDSHLTQVVSDKAADFIKSHKDDTFFLNVSFYAVHTPLEAQQDKIDKYQKLVKDDNRHKNANYAALVEHLDEGVGKILDAVRESGIENDTVVIFFSDNGGAVYIDRGITGKPITSNFPLRNGKVSQYEGGVKVPMFIRWPGKIPQGSVCRQRVIGHDFYPTMLSMAGAELKTDLTGTIDGIDLTSLFTDPDYNLDRDKLCWLRYPWLIHYRKDMDKNRGPVGSILKGEWKLIEFLPTPHGLTLHFELYNISQDPSEQNDLAGQMPDKVEELKKEMYKWREEVGAPAYSEAYKEYEKI